MSSNLPFAAIGRAALVGSLQVLALAMPMATAEAASDRVKSACKDDYFRHCSAHALGSDSLRQCMRGVGENLSTGCLVALVEDGEITKQDIERHKAKQAEAKADKPAANPATSNASAKAAPAKPDAAAKPVSPPKVASIGKTELPSASPKQKATPAKDAAKRETANSKPQSPPAKVASTGKASLPPPAADKPVMKASKTATTSGAKAAAPSVASRTGKAAPTKPVAAAALQKPPTPASKPAVRQPGMAALSGEGAQLSASAGQRFTRNVCHAKTIAGDPISQTCAIDEKCCFSGLAGKLRCVPQTATCNGL